MQGMDTSTITQLRTHRDEIRKSLKNIKASEFSDGKYGDEQEYTAKGLIAGVEAILFDISALTKAPLKFIQKSTFDERNQLVGQLSYLHSYIASTDLQNTAKILDQIKPFIRNTGVRHTKERLAVFEEHINELQKKANSLAQSIDDVSEIKLGTYDIKNEIDTVHQALSQKLSSFQEQEQELGGLIDETQEKRTELESLLSDDQIRSEEIEDLLASSKSHSEVIDGFSKKIATRESQLEDQEVLTNQYNEKLERFDTEHDELLSKANKLIESAKLALEYKTAEGLSAAFSAQYTRADNKYSKIGWLISAGLFVAASVGIGVWVALGQGLGWPVVISRISLLPILIGGAWFCAGQYVKQKNIAEDYAYKAALAKSIVGFSDQLATESDKGSDYSHYMKSVLLQIHNDPLRKHSPKSSENHISKEDIKVALEEIKGIKKVIEKLDLLRRSETT